MSGRTTDYESPLDVTIVAASRVAHSEFWKQTLLGRSLSRFGYESKLSHAIKYQNADGLSYVYNAALQQLPDERIVAFVHDDIFVHDHQLVWSLNQAHKLFDVVGVAGNTNPDGRHVNWCFYEQEVSKQLAAYPMEVLSGSISYPGEGAEESHISSFGYAPRACVLLDGCFLSVHVGNLRRAGIRFDERFNFHFYDIDFSRAASVAGLRVGTWPLTLMHASAGGFLSDAWKKQLLQYRTKWSDLPLRSQGLSYLPSASRVRLSEQTLTGGNSN